MGHKLIFSMGALFGGLSVILGAFAAHGLKSKLSVEDLEVFKTGVRYQFYHAFALLFIGILALRNPSVWWTYSACSFIIGILLFSGSLYLLSTQSVLNIEHWNWLGPITPIGGLSYIIGWAFFLWGILKNL